MDKNKPNLAKIIIGGDICPAGSAIDLFERGAVDTLFGPIVTDFEASDYVLVNLECPLFDGSSPILKDGPVLRASTKSINAFKNARINAVNLANNHVLDHGEEGLRTTIETCENAGILTIGAGENVKVARMIKIILINGIRVGLLGVAEHEFSIAGDDSWGANPLDLIDVTRNIKENRAEYDCLIVLLHGGCEHYPLPSPRLMETCRFFVELGANAVVCQHSHCAGCYEEYLGSIIIYGQGNLLFENRSGSPAWHEGFLVRLEIEKEGTCHFSMVPIQQSREHIGVRRFSTENEVEFIAMINDRSIKILEPGYIQAMWKKYCEEKKYYFLSKILGHNRILRRLNRSGSVSRLLYSKKSLLAVRNVLTCESHKEIMETAFESELLRS